MSSVILGSLFHYFRWITTNVIAIVGGTIEGVCFLTTALSYFKIYLAVRYHINQAPVLQVQLAQNGEVTANAARQRKSAVCTFYVYLVFLVCYLPSTCFWIVFASTGLNTMTRHSSVYSNTLLYLNSSLNPMIYSWKMRHIRHAVMDIVRNILPSHN